MGIHEVDEFLKKMVDDVPTYRKPEFSPLEPVPTGQKKLPMSLLNNIKMEIVARMGTTELTVRQLLALKEGDVLELDKSIGDLIDLFIDGRRFAVGEVVVINEMYGVRITGYSDEDTGKEAKKIG
ncbi:FliM/FliN family flagellar motor switch protein [Carboxydothermus ferrireducens]|uniref:Flagellar motor switch protein FliN/FliY n=1 Tax=Carboxydothermus ferrireducens DSM 11255 TaxID=1119529 RepID=A0ABX2R9V4_9THEO|nr:FliM/FliN family flagellar motor switch protein [Carboxydothermus ferrireducens]NYE56906.1 flagellar motor switch protein FliN/FliY [Carboxydothermus ferrireducens DSM 11255]